MLLSALLSNSWQMQSRSLVRTPQRLSLSERRLHKEPIQRSENRKQPHNVLPQAACFDLASATCPGHETWDEFLNFYRTADNFREKKAGGGGGGHLVSIEGEK